MLDPLGFREDFPIFNASKELVYLDNAATSQKPWQVIKAVEEFYREYNANIHRGLYDLSQKANEKYEEAHDAVAEFINVSRDEIVFVKNTTEAINQVMLSWGLHNVGRGDEILVTVMEHHSNLLPWYTLAELRGARVRVVDVDDEGRLDKNDFEQKINRRTRLVAVTHVSNVTGIVNDVEWIARIAHDYGARILVDTAQSAPHMPIDAGKLGVDFLAFSGHKMLGPTGIGVLYVSRDVLENMEMKPLIRGGGAVKQVRMGNGSVDVVYAGYPWMYEPGTPNIAGAIGLMEAIRYLERIGMEEIMAHEKRLVEYFYRRIGETGLDEKLRIMGPRNNRERMGIISFTLSRTDPHATAVLLDDKAIAVRSGFHCAQPLHERLGYRRGSVRASLYLYNTTDDIDRLVDGLKEIIMME
ncbi:MAG: cysteine desulfurase [Crenarchaeota archaeon]|nr:cysteine desulfurase [Thermoproteota archaeon]